MKFFRNLKVGVKLGIGFGMCLLFLVVILATGALSMSSMHRDSRAMLEDSFAGVSTCDDMNASLLKLRLWQHAYLAGQSSEIREIDREVTTWMDKTDSDVAAYDKRVTKAEDRKLTEAYKADWALYKEQSARYLALMNKDDVDGAITLLKGDMLKTFDATLAQGSVVARYNEREAQGYLKQMNANYSWSLALLLSIAFVALTFSIFFAVVLTRQITKPIASLGERMRQLATACVTELRNGITAFAEGDLTKNVICCTKPLEAQSRDELGSLTDNFNYLLERTAESIASYGQCRQNLTLLVRQLTDASTQVSRASLGLTGTAQQVESAAKEVGASMREISSASVQAARGASEVASGSASQAQSLSQSSHNIETLVKSVKSVAKDAELAADAAETAGKAATDGTAIVGESMKGMIAIRDTVSQSADVIHTLGESSQRIGSIVQTINEIAEQTNLLALNAAIEAARAGDAGRGFAVVADEVRKLAERSGSATREIGALISDIQTHTDRAVSAMEAGTNEVESQTRVAESTQAAFTKIQEVFQVVANRVEDIRSATQEMAGASQEVARSITEVAAVVEEASAAAEELSASAEEVSASVDTVAGAAQQQSAAVAELVISSDLLQSLAQTLNETVSSFRVDHVEATAATPLYLSRAA